MKAATEAEAKVADDTTPPAVSDGRRDEIRDELSDLDEQERAAVEALGEAQEELARIQADKREVIDELLGNSVQPDALELTPAMADEAINALRAEFDKGADETQKAGYRVQEGMDFAAVEAKLRATENEEQLKAVYRMVKAGSCPAVVCEEGGRYCIAETFGQILSERANCVYDRKAERQVGRENCNGNAVTQSQKMGVPLMERSIAKAHIVQFPDSNQHCYDYIQATAEERERGRAPCVYRYGGGAAVILGDAYGHGDYQGWRGALWI
ncbi:MAG: DUF4256 domain-containing protein [Candidatus Peregrinibacteria bacterium]|nr:DUF4256 domain-containing protein [Candidatus Peregrinibacteria bacterium]MCB9807710.1 DUF4256 domain-containing protein [Candidatus Peribacteria bacterium]